MFDSKQSICTIFFSPVVALMLHVSANMIFLLFDASQKRTAYFETSNWKYHELTVVKVAVRRKSRESFRYVQVDFSCELLWLRACISFVRRKMEKILNVRKLLTTSAKILFRTFQFLLTYTNRESEQSTFNFSLIAKLWHGCLSIEFGMRAYWFNIFEYLRFPFFRCHNNDGDCVGWSFYCDWAIKLSQMSDARRKKFNQ